MTTPPPALPLGSTENDLLNQAIRMVTPLRREFGRSLDIQHFLHDFAYAKEVIDEAGISNNERLRGYAAYFHAHLIGPRLASSAANPAAAVTVPAALLPADAADAAERQASPAMVDDLRQRMLKKHSTGVR